MCFKFSNVKIELHPIQSFLIDHDNPHKIGHNHDDRMPTSPLGIYTMSSLVLPGNYLGSYIDVNSIICF